MVSDLPSHVISLTAVHRSCLPTSTGQAGAELGEEARTEGSARYFPGDLCQKLTVKNLLSATVDAFDRIDILVNTARAFRPCDPLDPMADILDDMLSRNMKSALRISQMTARPDDPAGRGCRARDWRGRRDHHISTLAAVLTQPELMAYSIACAAQDQATRSLAVALAPHRIRVNGVSFASVMSRSLQDALKENDDWREAICEGTPLGRDRATFGTGRDGAVSGLVGGKLCHRADHQCRWWAGVAGSGAGAGLLIAVTRDEGSPPSHRPSARAAPHPEIFWPKYSGRDEGASGLFRIHRPALRDPRLRLSGKLFSLCGEIVALACLDKRIDRHRAAPRFGMILETVARTIDDLVALLHLVPAADFPLRRRDLIFLPGIAARQVRLDIGQKAGDTPQFFVDWRMQRSCGVPQALRRTGTAGSGRGA